MKDILAGILLILLFAAGAAGHSFYSAVQRGNVKETMRSMREIGTALIERDVEHAPLPSEPTEIGAVLPHLQLGDMRTHDGWGHPIMYTGSQQSWIICSYGRNGRPDIHPGGGGHESFDTDLI